MDINKLTSYILRKSKEPYEGDFPDTPEFQKPWENCITVARLGGEISLDGKPLIAEDFGECSALVLTDGEKSALFYIYGVSITNKQTKILNEFIESSSEGTIDGIIISGSLSKPTNIEELLAVSAVNIISKKEIDYDYFGVLYKPENKELLIDARTPKELLTFTFPVIYPAPTNPAK